MAFNSNTYHANKLAREAKAKLAEARDIKARVVAGSAYEWEAPGIARCASLAKIYARMSRSYRALRQLERA
jgi:hypothetical protein